MLSSFYPIVPGRTSDSQNRTRMLYQLQVDQIAIARIQEQLATGKVISKPSDDPAASIRVMGLQKANEFKVQANQNLKSSEAFLNITETTLSEIQGLLNEARGIAIQANTNTLSTSERQGFSEQMDALLQRVISSANTKFQDRFLMAGGSVASQPFRLEGNRVRFAGDNFDLLSAADENDYIAHNVTAQRAFGAISSAVVSTIDLDPGIDASTRLSDLNNGAGISPGIIALSNGSEQVSLDIAGAETLGDVAERFNRVSLGGRALSATIGTRGLVINYADALPGTLRITDIGVGSSAGDLGISTNVPLPTLPINGNDLDPILRRTTPIAQLQGRTGFDLQGGIEIKQGSKSYRIELSNANTIEDVINSIQKSGAAVRAGITSDGRSLEIRSTESGTDFSITESQSDLATRLGLRTFLPSTRLDQLHHGQGLSLGIGPDLVLERIDGNELRIDLDGAITIQDVLDRINNNVANQDPNTRIVASIHPSRNGLVLTSPSAGGTQELKVRVAGGSEVAWNLGLVPIGETEAVATLNGTDYVLTGSDPNPQEVEGTFNSLIRLRDAIAEGSLTEIGRSINSLDLDIDRLSLARGEVGVRLQRIDRLQETNESNQVEITSQQSELVDADLAKVISDLASRQAAQEASLQLLGQASKMSLFDFL